MIVFDACVLIAHLEATDALHQRGTEIMRATIGRQRRIPSLTLAEVLIGFERRGLAEQAFLDITGTLRFAEIPPDDRWTLRVAHTRVKYGLRLPDAVVLADAQRLNAQIATLDTALAQAAQADGRLFTPHAD
ncbi:MAG: PIN domain-containing protein [Micrococcales bacterium]|nr:PIN domain-containing protein [Micrococcales bacterium]